MRLRYVRCGFKTYNETCIPNAVSSSTAKCEGKMTDGKTLLLYGGEKQPHGETEPDIVSKQPGCVTAM
ncbi:hypothetical protein R3I93_017685 [Phoxinus phoxinus]|uniref:Uncharacterized protein n=1 Tax=Phoxinus phoxinus TaxID=58324 RepID=A0AAN9GWI6_9TELE